MSATALDRVVDSQAALIAALDSRDADAIFEAVDQLEAALAILRGEGVVREQTRDKIEHAVRQTQAARIRTNVLSDWTRQRIDRLAELRGQTAGRPVGTYEKPRI
jgi:BioD-like phosphotransacetylase family protein